MSNPGNITTLKQILIRRQVLVALSVFSLVAISLAVLFMSYINLSQHNKSVLVARSIERDAMLAHDSNDLQHAMTDIINTTDAANIAIYSPDGKTVLASSGSVNKIKKEKWFQSNPQLRSAIRKAGQTGIFNPELSLSRTSTVTILPLISSPRKLLQNHIHLISHSQTPSWHNQAIITPFSLNTILRNITCSFGSSCHQEIKLPKGTYSGIIVVELDRSKLASLAWTSFAIIGSFMLFAITATTTALSLTIHKYIINPLKSYSDIIKARRHGDRSIRARHFNIVEFDRISDQWNSLLNYKETAQDQGVILGAVLEHVPVGIEVADRDGRVEYVNPAYQKITGYSLKDVIGNIAREMDGSASTDQKNWGDALVAITKGETWRGEIISSRKDGSELISDLTLSATFDSSNEMQRIIAVRHDITSLKKHEETLVAAKIQAETANKAKSEFISNMSHELRTPLNSIIGFSELMSDQKLGPIGNDDYLEFATLIRNSSRSLLGSINAILDLSRIETHKVKINKTRFSSSEAINRVIKTRSSKAREMDISLNAMKQCDCEIYADEKQFTQSIGLLLCNAIKFNKPGGKVDISCNKTGDTHFEILVSDNGIGIPEQHIPHVTKPFYRVDNSFNRENDGIGLGLTLVKKFIEAHNGEMKITSGENGTTVSLKLPLASEQTSSNNESRQAA